MAIMCFAWHFLLICSHHFPVYTSFDIYGEALNSGSAWKWQTVEILNKIMLLEKFPV